MPSYATSGAIPRWLVGLVLFFMLLFSSYIGRLFVDIEQARPVSVRPLQPPSWELPFGSDKQGRNLFAVMVVGHAADAAYRPHRRFHRRRLSALRSALSARYYGGWRRCGLRGIVDVGLTIPGLMILIAVAMVMPGR